MIFMEKLRYLRVRELRVWSGNEPYSQAIAGCSEGPQARDSLLKTFGGIHGIEEAPLRITGAKQWSGVAREGDKFWQEKNVS